ncbi:hypothetical protein [Laribacter hongkongensis]|uniref:hypothetical protein n=1 Tax=Laribacter hongkongensis TaxID=168471 RepID=UPI001EFD9EB0|nr:hypothetical protein [Laribacter hongkongensis]MCG9082364.1 hypothetical protein [Laribacter hongkongensis]
MQSAVRDHAATCAVLHCCTTSAYAAAALNCSPDTAAAALRHAVSVGLFRRVLLPGLGRVSCYQPTAKAAGIGSRAASKFLRAGASAAAIWRGLLRGGAVFAVLGQEWLTTDAQALLREQHGIPHVGHADPLVGLDHVAHHHIYVPVPPAQAGQSASIIANAAARWLPLLEEGTVHLHFVSTAGRAADAVRAALAELVPDTHADATRELAELDARIAADKTGVTRIQLARQRAELAAALIATPSDTYPWLARTVVEVEL